MKYQGPSTNIPTRRVSVLVLTHIVRDGTVFHDSVRPARTWRLSRPSSALDRKEDVRAYPLH